MGLELWVFRFWTMSYARIPGCAWLWVWVYGLGLSLPGLELRD